MPRSLKPMKDVETIASGLHKKTNFLGISMIYLTVKCLLHEKLTVSNVKKNYMTVMLS